MAKQWYVVHTYSGYENKVKNSLEEKIKVLGKEELFGEVIVPTENVQELVRGQRKISSRKFFPGYIMVEMEMNDETWHIVKNIAKVTGFVGGTNPPSLPEGEVRLITEQIAEGKLKPKPKIHLEVGEQVRVVDGPLTNFNGVVDDIKPDKGKVRVLVSIFGRATPVELDFLQVERC